MCCLLDFSRWKHTTCGSPRLAHGEWWKASVVVSTKSHTTQCDGNWRSGRCLDTGVRESIRKDETKTGQSFFTVTDAICSFTMRIEIYDREGETPANGRISLASDSDRSVKWVIVGSGVKAKAVSQALLQLWLKMRFFPCGFNRPTGALKAFQTADTPRGSIKWCLIRGSNPPLLSLLMVKLSFV